MLTQKRIRQAWVAVLLIISACLYGSYEIWQTMPAIGKANVVNIKASVLIMAGIIPGTLGFITLLIGVLGLFAAKRGEMPLPIVYTLCLILGSLGLLICAYFAVRFLATINAEILCWPYFVMQPCK